ncbi:MAG: hypothetical protein P4L65_10560 [Legionella sp.]|nr:hypothetical protein [Legionella sp.]
MSKNGENLQELLAYKDSHAPWFWNEFSPPALVKRNLKLLRGLSGPSKMALEELDQLSEQDIKSTLLAYKTRSKQSADLSAAPTTASQFFHSTLSKSPYFCEIIPYSERIHNSPIKSQPNLLSASEQTNSDTSPKTEPVHGFHLSEGEAFSSTRYFSDDKKSRAQIIAKNGAFKATHQNLNNEQKTDLAFEMSYQFLLNLSPEHKKIKISGSPEMVHRLHAAFLCLQKESGTRYADVTFKLPEETAIAPVEYNDTYTWEHSMNPHNS